MALIGAGLLLFIALAPVLKTAFGWGAPLMVLLVLGSGLYLIWPAFYTDVTDRHRRMHRDRVAVRNYPRTFATPCFSRDCGVRRGVFG